MVGTELGEDCRQPAGGVTASDGNSATETRPRRRAAKSRAVSNADSTSTSTRRAAASNSRPSVVTSTWRVLRSNRR